MTRAINVNALETQVVDLCKKHNAPISAIETLRSGGTRVVLKSAIDAVAMTKAFGSKVLTGPVLRMPTRLMHG